MEWITAPSVDMTSGTRSYWDDAELIAYGFVAHKPSAERKQIAFLNGLVDPQHRGRGMGSDLLGWQVDTASELLKRNSGDLPRVMRVFAYDWIGDALQLFEDNGFSRARRFDEMLKTLRPGEPLTAPAGVSIVRWDRSYDGQALHANNAAFADHWGTSPMDPEVWNHILDATETRIDLSWLALADGEVVGLALGSHYPDDHEATGRHEGWVRILAVDRKWRGRGVGTALLRHSFHGFLQAGLTHSMLRVDSSSETGAHLLYEKVGYETVYTSYIYTRSS